MTGNPHVASSKLALCHVSVLDDVSGANEGETGELQR